MYSSVSYSLGTGKRLVEIPNSEGLSSEFVLNGGGIWILDEVRTAR